ncbi:DNA-directed RNA polymerase beta subunit, partial [hydrothermal vent metagenome]
VLVKELQALALDVELMQQPGAVKEDSGVI